MSRSIAVAALVAFVAMTLLVVPSAAMRFDHKIAVGENNHGSVHFRPDAASKKRLWDKVHGAVSHKDLHHMANLHAPTNAVADTITAEAIAHLGNTLFNKIGALVSAVVNQYGKTVVIPGESTSHFSFSDIHFTTFDVGSIDFAFIAPNKVRFSVRNLNIIVPSTLFHVYAKVLFKKVSCHGHFDAAVTGTSFEVDLNFATDTATKKLVVTSAMTSVTFGRLRISHKLSNLLCKVGQSVIQLLIGNIDKLITKMVRETMPKAVGPMVQQLLNKELGLIPLVITSQPTINTNGISLTVELLKYPNVAHVDGAVSDAFTVEACSSARPALSPVFRVTAPPKGSLMQMLSLQDKTPMLPPNKLTVGDNNRDINLIVTENNVNTALNILTLERKIVLRTDAKSTTTSIFKVVIPAAYARCPDCHLYIESAPSPSYPPRVDLQHSGNVSIVGTNIQIELFAVNSSAPQGTKIPLFCLGLNGTVQVLNIHSTGEADSTLKFELGFPVFQLKVSSSSVGPVPFVPAVGSVLRDLVQKIIVPSFNALFPGLVFPPELIQNVLADVSGGVANVGLNIRV